MRAFVLHEVNDFTIEEVKNPVPKDNEVLVKVKTAGICGSDIPRIYRTGTYSYPLIPGHEFSGIVVELGKNVDKYWLKKRVGIFPLIPCRHCLPCQQKQFELCRNYSYLGSRQNGGFAEYVCVPEENLIALPETVSFEQAAMLEPMAVAVHAIRRAAVKVDDTVAVCGLGTIGIMLFMFLMEAGVKEIYTIGNKDFQKQTVLKMGLSENQFCDIRERNVDSWLMEKTRQRGVDIFFDCVGKNSTLMQAISNTKPGGKILLVGNPVSDTQIERSIFWKILRNQLTLTGTWNSSFTREETDDWHYVLKKLEDGRIHPERIISHRMDFWELQKGFEIMRDKSEDYLKIMGFQ